MIAKTAPVSGLFLYTSILSLQPEWRDGLGSRKMVKIKLKIEFFVKGCKYRLLQSCTTIGGLRKMSNVACCSFAELLFY